MRDLRLGHPDTLAKRVLAEARFPQLHRLHAEHLFSLSDALVEALTKMRCLSFVHAYRTMMSVKGFELLLTRCPITALDQVMLQGMCACLCCATR
jgi:hypothetical protein